MRQTLCMLRKGAAAKNTLHVVGGRGFDNTPQVVSGCCCDQHPACGGRALLLLTHTRTDVVHSAMCSQE